MSGRGDRYVTLTEFARMIEASEPAVHRLVRLGALPTERIGGSRRVRLSVAEDYRACLAPSRRPS